MDVQQRRFARTASPQNHIADTKSSSIIIFQMARSDQPCAELDWGERPHCIHSHTSGLEVDGSCVGSPPELPLVATSSAGAFFSSAKDPHCNGQYNNNKFPCDLGENIKGIDHAPFSINHFSEKTQQSRSQDSSLSLNRRDIRSSVALIFTRFCALQHHTPSEVCNTPSSSKQTRNVR